MSAIVVYYELAHAISPMSAIWKSALFLFIIRTSYLKLGLGEARTFDFNALGQGARLGHRAFPALVVVGDP